MGVRIEFRGASVIFRFSFAGLSLKIQIDAKKVIGCFILQFVRYRTDIAGASWQIPENML
jgi:hypothetical protein